MILPIRYYGDPVLRQPARTVKNFDGELVGLAQDMIETMHDDNGVGLAAPQVGVPLRMFVASEYRYDEEGEPELQADHVLVNPKIVEREGSQLVQEGCLSIPGIYVDDMERNARVKLRYQDLSGDEREVESRGHFAQILQHETDHLDGILFFDRLPRSQRDAFLDAHRIQLAQIQRRAKALLKELRSERSERSRAVR